ncbi:MAG: sigma-70 family RNA polymerase sigma factor [Verrucomicrobia bacterium]|nr:sigma-70 family RNA polymerase sigma factor [Verrucomicrobiota bacterium]
MVQEVIISVARKMGEFKTDPSGGSFKSWLLNITRWRIIDQLRKRQKHAAVAAESPRSDDTARTSTIERVPDPANLLLETEWDAEWEKNLMEAALERVKGRMKPEQFQIFDLLVSKRWSAVTVAKRLHVSLAQVYYARHKVAGLVKKEIKKLEKQKV